MTRMNFETTSWLEHGVYTYREAGALMNVHPARVRRWADGYTFQKKYGTSKKGPILQTARDKPILCFPELIELFIVAEYDKLGVPLPIIRNTAEALKVKFGQYPFSHADIFVSENKKLLIPHGDGYERPDVGQVVASFVKVLKPQLTFENSNGLAYIYKPQNYPHIILNSRIRLGEPTVSDFAVPTKSIYKLWSIEKNIPRVAEYHEISEEEVTSAIQFESDVRFAS